MRANVGLAFIKRPKIFQMTCDAAVNMEDFMFTSLTHSHLKWLFIAAMRVSSSQVLLM